jgi:nitrogen fixation protein NifQ
MKWKKFFYRQLCEKAQVPICKSPSCAICTDYKLCFAPEEGEAKVPAIAGVPVRVVQ